jgi:hypothetical protein
MFLRQPPPKPRAYTMGVPRVWARARRSPLGLPQTHPGATVRHRQGAHVPRRLFAPHKSVQEEVPGPLARSRRKWGMRFRVVFYFTRILFDEFGLRLVSFFMHLFWFAYDGEHMLQLIVRLVKNIRA